MTPLQASGLVLAALLGMQRLAVAGVSAEGDLLPEVETCLAQVSEETGTQTTRIQIPGTDASLTLAWHRAELASSAGIPVNPVAEHVLVVDQVEEGVGTEFLADWTRAPEAAMAALESRDADTGQRICVERPGIPGVLTVIDVLFYMGHGAAHPQTHQRTRHWLLGKKRPLTADDVFRGDTWAEVLASLTEEMLAAALGDNYQPVTSEEFKAWVSDPRRWRFTREGLVIHFDAYEVAPYFAGAQRPLIPWARLQAFLAFDPRTGL